MKRHSQRLCNNGMALVAALMVVAVAATLVAGLFVQQARLGRQVLGSLQARQAGWILQGGTDWARAILREDARQSTVDHLGELWATPLSNVPVTLANGSSAVLQGRIDDAQSRFNLSALANDGVVQAPALAALEALLEAVQLSRALGAPLAQAIAQHSAGAPGWRNADQLASSMGITPANWARLAPYVVILPQQAPVNVNTAEAPVLAAVFADLSLAQAQILVARRNEAYFRDDADLANRLPGVDLSKRRTDISFNSSYFFVSGKVTLESAIFGSRVLIYRDAGQTRVAWEQEIS